MKLPVGRVGWFEGVFNVSSRQKLKFEDLLVTFKDLPLPLPTLYLSLCLSFTIIFKSI